MLPMRIGDPAAAVSPYSDKVRFDVDSHPFDHIQRAPFFERDVKAAGRAGQACD